MKTGLSCIEIDDLSFANPAGGSLPDAEDFHRAIWPDFGDDDADFSSADFEAYVDVSFRHWNEMIET